MNTTRKVKQEHKIIRGKEWQVADKSLYLYTHTHTHTHIYIYIYIYIYISNDCSNTQKINNIQKNWKHKIIRWIKKFQTILAIFSNWSIPMLRVFLVCLKVFSSFWDSGKKPFESKTFTYEIKVIFRAANCSEVRLGSSMQCIKNRYLFM